MELIGIVNFLCFRGRCPLGASDPPLARSRPYSLFYKFLLPINLYIAIQNTNISILQGLIFKGHKEKTLKMSDQTGNNFFQRLRSDLDLQAPEEDDNENVNILEQDAAVEELRNNTTSRSSLNQFLATLNSDNTRLV
jgi:hypothetical protein